VAVSLLKYTKAPKISSSPCEQLADSRGGAHVFRRHDASQAQAMEEPHTAPTEPGTVTQLLADLERGDKGALEALFPMIYEELRHVARRQRRNWNGDTTLGTTALVNEVYLKIVGGEHLGARNRLHFLKIASRAMRQILSNYARDRRATKRGAANPHLPIDVIGESALPLQLSDDQSELIANLNESLQRLESVDQRLCEVVECRFFGGLTIEDTASALGVSEATVKRDWALARAWLFRDLSGS
jgi:RNA polymerase sigma factor (TIGR02999 family)